MARSKRRLIALLLAACMLSGLLQPGVFAAPLEERLEDPAETGAAPAEAEAALPDTPAQPDAASGVQGFGDNVVVSQTDYTLAQGVTESHVFINTPQGTNQRAIFMTTVKPDAKATFKASYTGYYTQGSTAASRAEAAGKMSWRMEKPTAQAAALEAVTGEWVIMATNADYYNMQTSQPNGYLIMEGNVVQTWDGVHQEPYFGVTKDGEFVIRDYGADHSDIVEAISGPFYLVRNGQNLHYGNPDTYPVNSVGMKADGTVVTCLADGRQAPYSSGMTLGEIADFLIAQGVVDAIYLDGGGSASYSTRREGGSQLTLRSRPSDGVERTVATALIMVSTEKGNGVFDHASLAPNNEVYTPGSTVEFTATGVDKAGFAAELPESGLSWAVRPAEAGTVEDGLLTAAPGYTGEATVQLLYNGAVAGETTVQLQHPDQLYFSGTELSVDFNTTLTLAELGLNLRWRQREVHYKAEDFTWTVTGDVGTVTGDRFTSAGGTATLLGTLQVACGDLTSTVSVEVGKMPVVYMDFEPDEAGNPLTAAHFHWGKSSYVDSGVSQGYTGTVGPVEVTTSGKYNGNPVKTTLSPPFAFTGNWNSAVPAGDIFRANGYTAYLWPNNSISTYLAGDLKFVSAGEGGEVRFGDYSMELNYDYASYDGSSNSNFYVRYCGEDITIEGYPTEVGMWVYTPAGTPPYSLYIDLGYYNNNTGDYSSLNCGLSYTREDGTQSGVIRDAGWHYWSADIAEKVRANQSAEHPMKIINGQGMLWLSYQPGKEAEWPVNYGWEGGSGRKNGTLYFDNMRLVYGTNTDDLVNPRVTSIQVAESGEELADGAVLESNAFDLTISYEDPESPNRSGMDPNALVVELDGARLGPDKDEEKATIRTVLANGAHVLTVRAYDNFGNSTEVIRRFTVEGPGAIQIPTSEVYVECDSVAYLGRDFSMRVYASGPILGADLTINQLNADFGAPVVTGAQGATVEQTYTKTGFKKARLTLHITGEGLEAGLLAEVKIHVPTSADEASDYMSYAISRVTYSQEAAEEKTVLGTGAQPVVRMALTGSYSVDCTPVVAGNDAVTITVRDTEGVPAAGVTLYKIRRFFVYGSPTQIIETELGVTDEKGQLAVGHLVATEMAEGVLKTGDTLWLKANDGRDGLSFETPVVILSGGAWTDPWQGIHQNASVDPTTEQALSWLSDPTRPGAATTLRYKAEVAADWTVVEAGRTLSAFDTNKTAAYVNTVALTGLTPATGYVYQVGAGESWSGERRFSTAPAAEETTRFAVVGDTQMSGNQAADAEYLQIMADIGSLVAASLGDNAAAFVLQTGDYVDNGGNADMWVEIADAFAQSFPGTDLLHVLGNHEYYGNMSGDNANAILSLPGRDYYSVEYGNVYVAVINNSASLEEAAAWLKEDAPKSDCTWKVLSVHQPPYYTNGAAPSTAFNRILPPAAEAAGIHVVFSGHDHSYARTEPLRGGQVDSKRGITYFICGDLGEKSRSANYAIVNNPDFHFDFTTQEYTGLFLYVEATEETFTVTAKDSVEGHIVDSVTITNPCINGHEYTDYDVAADTAVCAVCGKPGHPKAEEYTGFLTRTDGERMYLVTGVAQTGWVQVGEEMHHFSPEGIWHEVEAVDSRTCTQNGSISYTCKVDGEKNQSQLLWAIGHKWDTDDDEAPHTCTVCGTQGVHIREATFTLTSDFAMSDAGKVEPKGSDFSLRYGGQNLSIGNSRYYLDGYVEYANNTRPGTATLTVVAKNTGMFYGAVSKTFTIHPQTVTGLTAGTVTARTVALTWKEAVGAERYEVYGDYGSGWRLLDTVTDTAYTAAGLTPDRYFRFKIRSVATADGVDVAAMSDSTALSVRTDTAAADSWDFITQLAYVTEAGALSLQKLGTDYAIFLPAHDGATPQALTLRLQVKEGVEAVNLQGDKGNLRLTRFGDVTVDVTELATREANGTYTLEISVDSGKAIKVRVTKGAGLATLYLTSADPETAGRDFVDANKANKATGSMKLVSAEGTVLYDGALTQIKGRGNSTFHYYDKKPYQIKLAAGADLLGTGESVKTWVLLANYSDATFLRDKLFKDLSTTLEMTYTPSCDWVELYYDGVYRGVYQLSEKNGVGTSGVDVQDLESAYTELNPTYGTEMQVKKDTTAWGKRYQYTEGLVEPEDVTGGYLLEVNKRDYDEVSGFVTAKDMALNVKSPEWAGKAAMDYISTYFQDFENAVYSPDGYNADTGLYYYDYCDLDSLVKMYLVQSLSGNCDAFYGSLFFYKDKGEKMYAGPIWDMEVALGQGWAADITAKDSFVDRRYLVEGLIQIEGFMEAVRAYWPTFRAAVLDLLGEEGYLTENFGRLEADAARDGFLWPLVRTGDPQSSRHTWPKGTLRGEPYTSLLTWLVARFGEMSGAFGEGIPAGLCDEAGHTWDGGKVTKAATAVAQGMMTYTCVLCGETKVEPIPALPGGNSGGTTTDPEKPGGNNSGNNSGSSVGGDVQPPQDLTPGDVTVPVSGTVRGDTVSGKVDTKAGNALVEEAIGRESGTVTVSVETDKAVNEAAVTLPAPTLGKLAEETQADLTVDTPVGSVSIPNESLGALEAPSGTVTVTVTRREDDLTVSVTRNGAAVASVPGLVARTAVQEEETGIVAVLVAEDGTETIVKKSVVEEDGALAILLNGSGSVHLRDNRKPFDDVAGHWALDNGAVDFVSSHELFQGVAPARFDANGAMSRAMLMTVLHRLEDTPDAGAAIAFTDVAEGEWYTEAISWGTQAGITNGMSETTFGGSLNITRQQLATMLYRYAGHIGLDVTGTNDLTAFGDSEKVDTWARAAMGWAVDAGIITGKPGGLLDANGTVTRGEAATMLMRLVRVIVA